jgi:membrane protein
MCSENTPEPGWLKRELSLLVKTVKEASQDHAKDLAAAIAFWAFLSIFPLLIGIFSLAGYFLQSSELQARIYQVVTEIFPGSGSLVRENLEAMIQYRGTMSWVGIGGLLWSASKGFGAITRAVNRALGAEQTDNFLLSKIRSFFMAIAVSISAITSIAITLAIEIVLDSPLLTRIGFKPIDVSHVKSWVLSLLLMFLTFALIYKLAPYVKVRWRQVLPGAFLAAVLFDLVKTAFVIYLDRFADFEKIYGSLSSIIVLLLWLYISALVLVLGAEYNIVRSDTAEAIGETNPGGAERAHGKSRVG